MCFFIKKDKSNIELLETECKDLVKNIDLAIGAANSYFASKDLYIDPSASKIWFDRYGELAEKIDKRTIVIQETIYIYYH